MIIGWVPGVCWQAILYLSESCSTGGLDEAKFDVQSVSGEHGGQDFEPRYGWSFQNWHVVEEQQLARRHIVILIAK